MLILWGYTLKVTTVYGEKLKKIKLTVDKYYNLYIIDA